MRSPTGEEVEMAYCAEMDTYEAEREFDRWVEDDAYNTVILPEYFNDLDKEEGK